MALSNGHSVFLRDKTVKILRGGYSQLWSSYKVYSWDILLGPNFGCLTVLYEVDSKLVTKIEWQRQALTTSPAFITSKNMANRLYRAIKWPPDSQLEYRIYIICWVTGHSEQLMYDPDGPLTILYCLDNRLYWQCRITTTFRIRYIHVLERWRKFNILSGSWLSVNCFRVYHKFIVLVSHLDASLLHQLWCKEFGLHYEVATRFIIKLQYQCRALVASPGDSSD